MKTLALLAVLAGTPTLVLNGAHLQPAPDAGWLDVELQDGGLEASGGPALMPDGGWVTVGPGCYLSSERCLATGQRLEQLGAENRLLRALPWVALGLGLAGGIALGILADEEFHRR